MIGHVGLPAKSVLASPFLLVKLFEKRELRAIRCWSNFGSIAQDHRPTALFVVKGGPLRQTLSVWIAVRREVNQYDESTSET
jgi:hypothetical protein